MRAQVRQIITEELYDALAWLMFPPRVIVGGADFTVDSVGVVSSRLMACPEPASPVRCSPLAACPACQE